MNTEIKGHLATIKFQDILLEHSGIFNLLMSLFDKGNIEAETDRILHDILLTEEMITLENNMNDVFSILRNSDNAESAIEKICENYGVTIKQAMAYVNMEIAVLSKMDFKFVLKGLHEHYDFYVKFYNTNFSEAKYESA